MNNGYKIPFKKKMQLMKQEWRLWVLVMPLLIWLALYSYKPMWGILIAFQKYSPFLGTLTLDWFPADGGLVAFGGSPFVGLDNFKDLMFGSSSEYFWRAFVNTIMISAYGIVFAFPAPIILALLFNELRNSTIRKSAQTAMYAPHFISEVIVCSLVLTFLAVNTGLVNILLKDVFEFFGKDYTQIQFMSNSNMFRPIYTLTGIWKEAGFGSIVFFAALCGIPAELYEAAKIDGANRFRQIFNISIPCILPTIVVMLIIRIGNILNVGYERVLLLYNPGIYDKADILSTYIYRLGIQNNPNYGLSTAATLVNSVIGLILVMGANKIAKRYSETTLW